MDVLIRNAELTKILIVLERGDRMELEERLSNTMENIEITINRSCGFNMLEREYRQIGHWRVNSAQLVIPLFWSWSPCL